MSTFDYRLPDVGEGLDQAEIMAWKVSVGDSVVPDQVLAEVETDKSMVEVPSPVAGVVAKLAGQPGEFIDVGASFVEIKLAESAAPVDGLAKADAPSGAAVSEDRGVSDGSGDSENSGASEISGTEARRRVLASPATRRYAVTSKVDLNQITGSGPAGRITKADVEAFLGGAHLALDTFAPDAGSGSEQSAQAMAGVGSDSSAGTAVPAAAVKVPAQIQADESVPFRGLRRTIAKNMAESWRSIPHITDFREIDATNLVAARAAVNDQLQAVGREEKVTYLPFLIRAVAVALRQRREFNSTLDLENEQITYLGRRNIGLAVSTSAGLFVPVIHDADSKMLLNLAHESQELAQGARDRSITNAQMSQGTFTITNFGSYGGWLGTPIIRPPEVAIAGFGKIADKVVPVDGQPAVRKVLPIAVSADHRVIDGADMGAFLQILTQLLENPILLTAGDF